MNGAMRTFASRPNQERSFDSVPRPRFTREERKARDSAPFAGYAQGKQDDTRVEWQLRVRMMGEPNERD